MNKLFLVILFFIFQSINGQFFKEQRTIDEVEVSMGFQNLQGDFGIRDRFETTLRSIGGNLSGKVYLNLTNPYNASTYLGTHITYNVAVNLSYTNLAHKGYEDYPKIDAITGRNFSIGLGVNVEYHLSDIRNSSFFTSDFLYSFDPYMGGGIYGYYYNVILESSLGDINDPAVLPSSYTNGIYNGSRFTGAFHIETGIRYKHSDFVHYVFKSDWMYFMDDKVDGLNPDPDLVKNLHNDWILSTSIGVIFYLP
jgi:hypothetical protein